MTAKFRNITPRTEGDLLREAFSRIEELEKLHSGRGVNAGINPAAGGISEVEGATAVNIEETAVNQAATATTQSETPTNQPETAVNQAETALNQSETAENQSFRAINQSTPATNQPAPHIEDSALVTEEYFQTVSIQTTTNENSASPTRAYRTCHGYNVATLECFASSLTAAYMTIVEATFWHSSVKDTVWNMGCETDTAYVMSVNSKLDPAVQGHLSFSFPVEGNHSGHKFVATCLGGAVDHIRLRLITVGGHVHNHNAHNHIHQSHRHTHISHSHTPTPHNHTQNSHTHTQNSHTHTQISHNHIQDSHNHTQDSHNHIQDSHTHIQDSHNHIQDPHNHLQEEHTHATA